MREYPELYLTGRPICAHEYPEVYLIGRPICAHKYPEIEGNASLILREYSVVGSIIKPIRGNRISDALLGLYVIREYTEVGHIGRQ
jgi:hypothetical protein